MIIILWWALVLLSYVLYPWAMKWFARGKSMLQFSAYDQDELPSVSIVMAVHNEEKVLKDKIASVLDSRYDLKLLKFYIGLDDCTDQSLQIVQDFKQKHPDIIEYISSDRLGKPNMLNLLMQTFQPQSEVTIFTDANVMFQADTLYELVKHFKTPYIGLVDSQAVLDSQVISHQHEHQYLNFEQNLKFREGLNWGVMQGPFGGCFAMRTHLFKPVPENFLVDDFFLGMHVMKSGYWSISNPSARVQEEVHTSWNEEFRRKKRIATGNFQNLVYFSDILHKPFTAISISWFFHKIIRWTASLLFLVAIILNLIEISLFKTSYYPLTITLTLIIGVLVIQCVLQRLNLHIRTIERLSYFIYINLAFVQGFLKYIKGVKSNVWKPTKRK